MFDCFIRWGPKSGDVGLHDAEHAEHAVEALRVLAEQVHADGHTLEGSFSAVSKPNFARKYAFESYRRDLHNALLCTALQSHFL